MFVARLFPPWLSMIPSDFLQVYVLLCIAIVDQIWQNRDCPKCWTWRRCLAKNKQIRTRNLGYVEIIFRFLIISESKARRDNNAQDTYVHAHIRVRWCFSNGEKAARYIEDRQCFSAKLTVTNFIGDKKKWKMIDWRYSAINLLDIYNYQVRASSWKISLDDSKSWGS